MNFLRQIVPFLYQAVKQHLRQWTQLDAHSAVYSAAGPPT